MRLSNVVGKSRYDLSRLKAIVINLNRAQINKYYEILSAQSSNFKVLWGNKIL